MKYAGAHASRRQKHRRGMTSRTIKTIGTGVAGTSELVWRVKVCKQSFVGSKPENTTCPTCPTRPNCGHSRNGDPRARQRLSLPDKVAEEVFELAPVERIAYQQQFGEGDDLGAVFEQRVATGARRIRE